MKRLNWLTALVASTLVVSAAASADDHRGKRDWDRHHQHYDRWDRGDRYGRWDDRRYIHARPNRYWIPPGHRYGYAPGYWNGRYYGGSYSGYYGGGAYCPPRYRRSGVDGTLILSFPIW